MTRHIDEIGNYSIRLATTLGRLKRPAAKCGTVVISNGGVDSRRLGVLDEHSLVGAGESRGQPDHVACLVLHLDLEAGHVRFEFAEAFSHASRGLADCQWPER